MIPFPEEHARSRRTQVGPEPAGQGELAIHVVQGWADSLHHANPASTSVGNPTRDSRKTYQEAGPYRRKAFPVIAVTATPRRPSSDNHFAKRKMKATAPTARIPQGDKENWPWAFHGPSWAKPPMCMPDQTSYSSGSGSSRSPAEKALIKRPTSASSRSANPENRRFRRILRPASHANFKARLGRRM